MDDFEQLDYYELLGISRSASTDEIKRAYRQQMSRFHPDRFSGATPAEQEYASRRALRINEAYRVLSDFNERSAYNRNLGARHVERMRPQAVTPPAPPRDHLAELYEQARTHMAAGRHLQAVATLREIQKLNPFYRDSAALLAEAEAAARPAPSRKPVAKRREVEPDQGRRRLLMGGLGGLLIVGGGAAAWLLRRPAGSSATLSGGATPAGAASSASIAEISSSASVPAATPIPIPISPTIMAPTPTSLASPTPPPSPTIALIAEAGELRYREDFSSGNAWPTISGNGWSVSYAQGAYQIRANEGVGNIWAFRNASIDDNLTIGIDVETQGGLAGMLLRYSGAGSYLAFFVNPAEGSFKLEQRSGGNTTIVAEERHPSVISGEAAQNRLAARMVGEQLDLRINGQRVLEISLDSPPRTAQYGMIVVARSPEVVALFRKLEIREG